MSQSIGIHLGERTFHLLALDGGLKKHKVVCAVSGEIPSGEDAAQGLVERLREIAREHKLKADSVYLAIDSGVAAFRNLTLPFDDHAKIEEVLKFEVEGNLPQFDIEQVVVDFLVLSSKPGVESSLLVTAVPKDRLGAALKLCERAGLEPLDAELEGTALFDAAFEAGTLSDEAGTVLIHVGDTSTTVVVADGRRLVSVRAIRVGAAMPREPEIEEEGSPGGEAAPPGEAGRGAESVQRIRRELQRTLSGARTAHEIKNVYVCGQALPGLAEGSLLDVPVQALPFTLGSVESPGSYVVAFGAALRGFEGGKLHPSLRREELRFSGRFERLELPLAVLALLVFTLLFVQYIILDKQLEWRDEGNLAADPPIKGDMQIWLEASNLRMLPDPTNPRAVRLSAPPEALARYAEEARSGADTERTKFEELMRIRALLKIEIDKLGKELGRVSEIKQPQSSLTAATLVMDQFAALGPDARVGIRRLEASFQGQSGNKEDYVVVTVDADFYGATPLDATRLREALESQTKEQPWCLDFEGKSSKPLDGGKGIQVDGLTIQVNVDKAPGKKGGEA